MPERDDKIRREVLKELYELFEEDPAGRFDGESFLIEVSNEFDRDEVVYNVERMDGDLVDKRGAAGTRVAIISITADGIENLHADGFETILDFEHRYEILRELYEEDRNNPRVGYVSRDDLSDELGIEFEVLDRSIWYLKDKGLIEVSHAGGGYFYRQAKITDRGRNRYEKYSEDGVEIPRSGGSQSLRQASIGPDEAGKAENLFRDFVELAQEEVVVIDRYAREGLYELLDHVPAEVQIRVVTTERVTGGDYAQVVSDFVSDHPDIEVRHLSDSDWGFHDRYLIRDGEDGWNWGHSFHDAGDTQHTASELKPVNLVRTIEQFEETWEEAESVL